MLASLNTISHYILRLTFPIRRWLLRALVFMAVVPGIFVFKLPFDFRMVFAYVFVSVMGLGFYSVANVYAGSVVQLFFVTILSKKYKTTEYTTTEIEQLKAKMGLSNIKVYLTNNPFVRSPFTNTLSKKVYLTSDWLKQFPPSEILSTVAHEFGHLKTLRRFGGETGLVTGAALAFGIFLSLHTISIMADVAELSAMILGLTYVSWKNERRADLISAREVGPEGMIAVLEQLKSEVKRDEGSETHPPLHDRIARLLPLLDNVQVRKI